MLLSFSANPSINMAFVKAAVASIAGGIFAVNSVAHLFPNQILKKVKEWRPTIDQERHSEASRVPDRCKIQLKKVLKKLDAEEDFERITLFISHGDNPVSAGAVWLPAGVVIGLPKYFLYEKEEDVISAGLTVKNSPVDMKTELGRKCARSLYATDDNIAFVIGRELSHSRMNDLLTRVFLSPSWFYGTYRATFGNTKLLAKQSKLISLAVKVSLCWASYLAYITTSRSLCIYQVLSADRRSAELDTSMALGGVDYTLKRLKLNSLLRVLLGSDGRKLFSKEGELLTIKGHPKLMERLRMLEEIAAENMGKIHHGQKM